MAQWITLLWYNSCVNRQQLPLCEKTAAIALVLSGLTASRLVDKIVLNSELLK